MDADRFDTLAKRLVAPTNRRSALAAAVAGGFFSALGIGRAAPATRAAQGGICVMAFTAQVLQGPSAGQPLTPQGNRPGEVRGDLSFSLSATGNLENATLTLGDGTTLPVVGQATGYALQVRIELAPRVAIVAIGVGEREIAACQGAIDGVASGPEVGDLGDWHAAGVQQARGGGQSGGGSQGSSTSATQGGTDRSGNRTDRSGSGGASGGSSGGGGGGQNSSGSSSESPSESSAPSCPPGETFCDREDGYCADLDENDLNCGACGNVCLSGTNCENGECAPGGSVDCPVDRVLCGAVCCAAGEGCLVPEEVCAPVDCPTGQVLCGAACCDACQTGLTDCGVFMGCVDLNSDQFNCGSCGAACVVGEEVCSGAQCVPAGGGGCKDGNLTYCGGACVALNSDPANCGGCGIVCAGGMTCSSSVCVLACLTGLTNCNGVCVDLNSDPANCGNCGVACAAGETCQFGACVAPAPAAAVCADGLTDCFGVCVDLNSDSANCAGCGFACPAGETCQFGGCLGTIP